MTYRLSKRGSKSDIENQSSYILEKRKNMFLAWKKVTQFYASGDGEAMVVANNTIAAIPPERPEKVLKVWKPEQAASDEVVSDE